MKKLAAICALSLAVPAMGELVTNGGFEAGTGNDADNWNQIEVFGGCLLYTSPSPRDRTRSRMPSSA